VESEWSQAESSGVKWSQSGVKRSQVESSGVRVESSGVKWMESEWSQVESKWSQVESKWSQVESWSQLFPPWDPEILEFRWIWGSIGIRFPLVPTSYPYPSTDPQLAGCSILLSRRSSFWRQKFHLLFLIVIKN
jgi:hypothetical protein